MAKRSKGIYCLEIGEWYGSLKHRTSVEPALQLLAGYPLKVPYIHRDIATETELRFYIRKWCQGKHHAYSRTGNRVQGAGIKRKSHIQVAARDPHAISATFAQKDSS